jgi:hypothetical protein
MLILFVSNTFAPPGLPALCGDECREFCVEAVRTPHTVCITQPVHKCGSPETCDTGIAHHHAPATDIPGEGIPVYTQDRERLPKSGKTCAVVLPGRGVGTGGVPDPETEGPRPSECYPICDAAIELIQSVVLLI